MKNKNSWAEDKPAKWDWVTIWVTLRMPAASLPSGTSTRAGIPFLGTAASQAPRLQQVLPDPGSAPSLPIKTLIFSQMRLLEKCHIAHGYFVHLSLPLKQPGQDEILRSSQKLSRLEVTHGIDFFLPF